MLYPVFEHVIPRYRSWMESVFDHIIPVHDHGIARIRSWYIRNSIILYLYSIMGVSRIEAWTHQRFDHGCMPYSSISVSVHVNLYPTCNNLISLTYTCNYEASIETLIYHVLLSGTHMCSVTNTLPNRTVYHLSTVPRLVVKVHIYMLIVWSYQFSFICIPNAEKSKYSYNLAF